MEKGDSALQLIAVADTEFAVVTNKFATVTTTAVSQRIILVFYNYRLQTEGLLFYVLQSSQSNEH